MILPRFHTSVTDGAVQVIDRLNGLAAGFVSLGYALQAAALLNDRPSMVEFLNWNPIEGDTP